MPATGQTGQATGQHRPDPEQVDQARLRSALNRYLAARTLAPGDPERAAARAALVHLLEEAGWEPPAAVRRALLQERRAS